MSKSLSRTARMLTVADFADRLEVCKKTIRRLIDKGELPAHRVGRLIRISEADAVAFLATRRS